MALDLTDQQSNVAANDLTNNGATEYTLTHPFAASTEAVAVTSVGKEYLIAADSTSLSITGNITLMCWVNFVATTGNYILSKWNNISGSNRSFTFYINGGNTLNFTYSNDGSAADTISVSWTPSTATWYNIAISWTAATKVGQFVVDGSQVGTDQTGASITSLYDGPAGFQINGKDEATMNGPVDAFITDVRVYNTARTVAAIAGDYNTLISKTATGLVAYWPFQTISAPGGSSIAAFKSLLGVGQA